VYTASHNAAEAQQQFDYRSVSNVKRFRKLIYTWFAENSRDLPWRTDYNPYHIYISEVMLQQTQVDRVYNKFVAFIEVFPDFRTLASAPLEEVYRMWQGLGYNRRAASLRNAAQIIMHDFHGKLPDIPDELVTLPGIGSATAASIAAFAFNKPGVFLETNIRTVLIHHFFPEQSAINDTQLLMAAEAVLDKNNARKWYSALMDYGTVLKKEVGNLSRKSTAYKKQSAFHGSKRQVRGEVLRLLLEHKKLTIDKMHEHSGYEKPLLKEIVTQMTTENIVRENGTGYYSIGK